MKKILWAICLVLIGGCVAAFVDSLIGLKFEDVNFVVQLVHKTTYLLFGAAISFICR